MKTNAFKAALPFVTATRRGKSMTPLTSQSLVLSQAIRTTLGALLASGAYPSAQAVNQGYCTTFAHDVYDALGGLDIAYKAGISDVGVSNFLRGGEEGSPFDKKMIAEHWPYVKPTQGLSWRDLNQLSEDAWFCEGTHVWLVLNSRHYDAECPDGVDNFFDLPFFCRIVEDWKFDNAKKTAKEIADKYANLGKGAMPAHEVTEMYNLTDIEVAQLAQKSVITIEHIQSLERFGRCKVAVSLFDKCDVRARHALLNDEHHFVQSCAAISDRELQSR